MKLLQILLIRFLLGLTLISLILGVSYGCYCLGPFFGLVIPLGTIASCLLGWPLHDGLNGWLEKRAEERERIASEFRRRIQAGPE